jgi:hypothetical protein
MSPERAAIADVRLGSFATLIRAGTPGDAEAVARVHVRTWQVAYAHVFPSQRLAELSVERLAAQWREWPPLVAEVDGTVVGFVSIGPSRTAMRAASCSRSTWIPITGEPALAASLWLPASGA